ncbi:MAG: helix-turn-helix domain-containing protein [archaeon]
MDFSELKVLGLTDGGIKVYSAILHIGISSINGIHERTGMERRAIYDNLNKLIEKGLVSYTMERGKRQYRCAPLNMLHQEVESKKRELARVESIIPLMDDIYRSSKRPIGSEVFRGSEGIKAVWEDMLDHKEVRWIGSGRYVPKRFPHWFSQWNKRRIERGSKWYNLVLDELRSEVEGMPLEEVKVLPKEFSGPPVVVAIYGNKVVNFILGVQFFAFSIESEEVAFSYRRYHKSLWDNVATDL